MMEPAQDAQDTPLRRFLDLVQRLVRDRIAWFKSEVLHRPPSS